jgi:hypothetical protein
MKEHSILIGSCSSSPSKETGEICWEPQMPIQMMDRKVKEEYVRGCRTATNRERISRSCKITPLDAMMMEYGEPSSSSSLSPEQEELQRFVRKSMDLTVDSEGYLKPKAYEDKQHPKKKISPYQEDVLEMHESIQSMMSFSVSDLVEEEEENKWSREDDQKDTLHDKSMQESIESILSVSYSKLMELQEENDRNVALSKQRVAPANTKSCSTLTTAAMSKSSQELEGVLLENSAGECSFPLVQGGARPANHFSGGCFKTPSRTRQRFQPSSSDQFSVPQHLFSPLGTMVSPLSVDPSPGHTKMYMHTELLKRAKKMGTAIGRFSSGSDDSIVSQPLRVSEGRRCSSLDRDGQYVSCNAKFRNAMDSFESLDFVPEPLGLEEEDEEVDETVDGEDVFIVDNGSVAHGSTESMSVGSRSSSANRLSHFSPIGRQDMATFTWKRNLCPSSPSKTIPNRQRSADNVLAREVNPRTNARIVHKNRSVDNVLRSVSQTRCSDSIATMRDEYPRPPTPVKRRTKMRSKKVESAVKADRINTAAADQRNPSVKQKQRSEPILLVAGTRGSDASCASNGRGESKSRNRMGDLILVRQQQQQQQQHRHQPPQHRHRRDLPETDHSARQYQQRQRSRSRPRSQSRSRTTKKPSSRRHLAQLSSALDI